MTLEEYKQLNQSTIDELAMAPESSTVRDSKVILTAIKALESLKDEAALKDIGLIIMGADNEGEIENG